MYMVMHVDHADDDGEVDGRVPRRRRCSKSYRRKQDSPEINMTI